MIKSQFSFKKYVKRLIIIIPSLYVLICILLYFFQERLLFVPKQLSKSYEFTFDVPFEELDIETKDGLTLNSILFKSQQSKGLIFLVHGNAGSLKSIGGVAKTYIDMNFDVFILDYRGFGKSEGEITQESDLYEDNQIAYDLMKKKYKENQIFIQGYSIGTALAAKLASDNHPKSLVLEAPYYSMKDLMSKKFAILPTFLLRYKLETHKYLAKCKMPIFIFHGTEDRTIYYGSSVKLKKELKSKVQLFPLEGLGHTGFSINENYLSEMKKILNE